ncbi:MAG: Trm112 family protein [bacterium]
MNVKEMADEFLVCPKCRGSLIYKIFKEKEILICKICNVYYSVEDEIPILLIEEAKNIGETGFDL